MDRRIQEVLVLLDREWRRNHRIEELATTVNLRPSRLQHLFKAAVQRTIRDVVLARRIEEAAKLIASTYERISEIAYFVGFRDVSNFNHAFRRRFGMSPRQYRAAFAGSAETLQEEPNQNTRDQLIPLAGRAPHRDIGVYPRQELQASRLRVTEPSA